MRTFRDLQVGSTFSFEDGDDAMFKKRCEKTGPRTYKDEDGNNHRIGRTDYQIFDAKPPAGKKKFGIIICGSRAAAEAWIDRLRRAFGLNYFVLFRDKYGPAIQYGYAEWAARDCMGGYHVNSW